MRGVSDKKQWTLRCPECEATLVIDAATGEVISHRAIKKPPAEGKDMETLLAELEQEKAEAESVFDREMAAMEDRDRLLEEKFQQALKRAEEDPDEEPPLRPIDLD